MGSSGGESYAKKLKLHPHTLIRVAGGDFDSFQELNLTKTPLLIDELISLKEGVENYKIRLSDILFKIIKSCTDEKTRTLFINIKRDIFNLRPLSTLQLEIINAAIKENDFHPLLLDFLGNIEEAGKKSEEIENSYNDEINDSRNKLIQLASRDNFKNGLLLSSKVLFNEIPDYINNKNKIFNKKLNQTEISIIKYIARIYTKTSPFSTFTNLCLGEINNNNYNGDDTIRFKTADNRKPVQVVSHIRLNNILYKYLKEVMLQDYEIAKWFKIRLNPTVKINETDYLFLTNHNNEESFQRMIKSVLPEMVIETINKYKKEIAYGKLIKELHKRVDAEFDDLKTQLNFLIEYGFIEFNIGVSGIDPNWDTKLIKKLKNITEKNKAAIEISNTLITLGKYANKYATVSTNERKIILNNAYNAFIDLYNKLSEGLNSRDKLDEKENGLERDTNSVAQKKNNSEKIIFKKGITQKLELTSEKMFYEDTTLNASANIPLEKISKVISSLDTLMQLLKFSENLQIEHFKMAYFFRKKYGAILTVDFLTFHENYHKEYKKVNHLSELENTHDHDIKKIELINEINNESFIKAQERLLQNWRELLLLELGNKINKKNNRINLDANLLEKINRHLSILPVGNKRVGSHGTFIQFLNNEKTAVVNGVFMGYGKIFSRFLPVLKKETYKQIVEVNSSCCPSDSMFIENTDSSYFNGNIHPPLLNFELCSPESNNNLNTEKQIPITELEVNIDKSGDKLFLTHKPCGKRVYIFDLGFEGSARRSPMFQLLSFFPPVEFLSYRILTQTINDAYQKKFTEREIIIYPRIIFENNLILQRMNWIIPKEKIWIKNANEKESDYFVRINEWRKNNEIPNEVFIKVIFQLENQPNVAANNQKTTKDDYKPQYINFSNPFLVKLFNKLISKASSYVKLEEMLPTSNNLLKLRNGHYVTEFSLQWHA
jgi:hypothetical protein